MGEASSQKVPAHGLKLDVPTPSCWAHMILASLGTSFQWQAGKTKRCCQVILKVLDTSSIPRLPLFEFKTDFTPLLPCMQAGAGDAGSQEAGLCPGGAGAALEAAERSGEVQAPVQR